MEKLPNILLGGLFAMCSEQIQHTVQVNCLPDGKLILGLCHVVEQKFQNQGAAQAPALQLEMGKAHGQIDI